MRLAQPLFYKVIYIASIDKFVLNFIDKIVLLTYYKLLININ